jgi:hypothetical protein
VFQCKRLINANSVLNFFSGKHKVNLFYVLGNKYEG